MNTTTAFLRYFTDTQLLMYIRESTLSIEDSVFHIEASTVKSSQYLSENAEKIGEYLKTLVTCRYLKISHLGVSSCEIDLKLI